MERPLESNIPGPFFANPFFMYASILDAPVFQQTSVADAVVVLFDRNQASAGTIFHNSFLGSGIKGPQAICKGSDLCQTKPSMPACSGYRTSAARRSGQRVDCICLTETRPSRHSAAGVSCGPLAGNGARTCSPSNFLR